MNKKVIGGVGYLLILTPASLNFLAMSYYLMRNFFSSVFFDTVVTQSPYGQVVFSGFYGLYFLNGFLVFVLSIMLVKLLRNPDLK